MIKALIAATAIVLAINPTMAAPKLSTEARAIDWIYSSACETDNQVPIMRYLQRKPHAPLARAIVRIDAAQIVPVGIAAWCKDMEANY